MSNRNKISKLDGDTVTKECALFENLVEAPPAERRQQLDKVRTQSPAMCARLEKLLDVHDTTESQTPSTTPQEFHYSQGDKIDDYEIVHFLASGGEADIYLARQTTPIQRTVAIKVLRQRLGAATHYQARFQSEKTALARLIHPSIAKIFDAGVTSNGEHYYAVEYVSGPTVSEYFADHNLSLEDRLWVFVEICSAVEYANENGIFHRDLKPSNIIVSDATGEARPVVIDFGIAKVNDHTNDTLTHQGDLLGTLGYIAPERLEDARISNSQSEVYSLGAVLYEMVCQQPIVTLDSNRGLFAAVETLKNNSVVKPSQRLKEQRLLHRSAESRKPAALLPSDISAELDWICLKAVAKNPDQRYASARELRKDICRCLEGQPVEAAPPGRWYQTKKFYQRHRLACVLSMMLLMMLLICVFGSAYWALKLDAARRAADQLAAKSQNNSLHISTVLEFMMTAFDTPGEEGFSAVAICGEQLLNAPSLEDNLRRDVEYNSTTARIDSAIDVLHDEHRQHDDPRAADYANPNVPHELLDKQRIRFFDQFLQKQIDRFGHASPYVVETLLNRAKAEIRLNHEASLDTLGQAQKALKELGRDDSDPQVKTCFELLKKARESLTTDSRGS